MAGVGQHNTQKRVSGNYVDAIPKRVRREEVVFVSSHAAVHAELYEREIGSYWCIRALNLRMITGCGTSSEGRQAISSHW